MSRYSARQKRMRGINGRSKRQFMRLYSNVKRSKAYHSLSLYGRAFLFELLDRYNGINNGMIGLGVREAAYELRCGRSSINRAMREIDDAGLAIPMTLGDLRGKRATEWRLTFLRCDVTGELPRSTWEQREPFSLSRYRNTKGPLQEPSAPHCPAGGTQNGNSSMKWSPHCPAGGTHLDIYQYPEAAGNAPTGEVDGDDSSEANNGAQNHFGPRRRAS